MKKILVILLVLLASVAHSQPFAKIDNINDGNYVNISTLTFCDIIFGKDIYTPQGKVTPQTLQGFIECQNISECITALNCDEKHIYIDTVTYSEANIDARNNGYKTFIYKQRIYLTN